MQQTFDYTPSALSINTLLPDVFVNDTSTTILGNGIDRFTTVDDAVPVDGYVSRDHRVGNLPEFNNERIYNQLQPIVSSPYDNNYTYYTHRDILQKLEQMGVDVENYGDWAKCTNFNFAPPINPDKLINYQNYYWVDPSNSEPQYVTIRNRKHMLFARYHALSQQYAADHLLTTKAAADAAFVALYEFIGGGFDTAAYDDNEGDWDYNRLYASLNVTPPNSSADFDESAIHADQWISQNRWVHVADLPENTSSVVATMPIIEYDEDVELNSWVRVVHEWRYRKDATSPWVESSPPSPYELNIRAPIIDIANDAGFVGSTAYHDVAFLVRNEDAAVLSVGMRVSIVGTTSNNGSRTITELKPAITGAHTVVYTAEVNTAELPHLLIDTQIVANDYIAGSAFGAIVPTIYTSHGDKWLGLFVHWSYRGIHNAIPTGNQIPNPTQRKFTCELITAGYDLGVWDTSLDFEHGDGAIHNSIIVSAATTNPISFVVDGYIANGDNYYTAFGDIPDSSMSNFSYIVGANDVCVYVNGQRRYTGWDEMGAIGTISSSVVLNTPVSMGDLITLCSGAAAESDATNAAVWVNTPHGIMPSNLTEYRRQEQIKTSLLQYPMFNLYKSNGVHAGVASRIFGYEYDDAAPINSLVDMRIRTSDNGKVYHYTNDLVVAGRTYYYKKAGVISSVWRKGLYDEITIPRYVNDFGRATGDVYTNELGATVTALVPAGSGRWDIPQQLFCNPHHDNRHLVSSTDLIEHYNTIIKGQATPSELGVAIASTPYNKFRLINELNYGLGGTVKEHNNNYDLLISTLLCSGYSLLDVIDFAKLQYLAVMENITEILASTISALMMSRITGSTLPALVDDIIAVYSTNDHLSHIYHDSTSTLRGGIANIIATCPMLGLSERVYPHILRDNTLGILQLVHHDGHITDHNYSTADIVSIIKSAGIEVSRATLPPIPTRYGVLWANAGGGVWQSMVRFYGTDAPHNPHDGDLWYNTGILKRMTAGTWVHIALELAWQLVDITELYLAILLEVEMRMFDVSPPIARFSAEQLIQISDELSAATITVDELTRDSIAYANNYTLLDQFTWNYYNIDLHGATITPPYPTIVNAAHWTMMYYNLYGTAYPHLEPWVLQGYHSKPVDWDTQYADLSNTRRWVPQMWQNIINGDTSPLAVQPPTAARTYTTRLSVNISAVEYSGYAPDALLPPYITDPNLVGYTIVSIPSITSGIITAISAQPLLGEGTLREFNWLSSYHYPYDLLRMAFKLQPLKALRAIFDDNLVVVNGMQVNRITDAVDTHKEIVFHGTLHNGIPVYSNGANQWYVNKLRYEDIDIASSEFISRWRDWDMLLTYQTDSMVLDGTLAIHSTACDVSDSWDLRLKTTQTRYKSAIDELRIVVAGVGASKSDDFGLRIPSNMAADWEFWIDAVHTDKSTIDTLNVFDIAAIDDHTNIITLHAPCSLPDSAQVSVLNNDTATKAFITMITPTTCTLASSNARSTAKFNTYKPYTEYTHTVSPTEPSNPTDGDIWMYASGTVNTFKQYYKSTNTWRINDPTSQLLKVPAGPPIRAYYNGVALVEGVDYTRNGIWMEIITELDYAVGAPALIIRVIDTLDAKIGEIKTVIDAGNQSDSWYEFSASHKEIDVTFPVRLIGAQQVINFVYGYAAARAADGFIVCNNSRHRTDALGNSIGWSTEVKYFINSLFSGYDNRYDIITSTSIQAPPYVINPIKYHIWYAPSAGVVAPLINKPARGHTKVYDQNGAVFVNPNGVQISRSDKETYIRYNGQDAHIGAALVEVDTYEHIIVFDHYAVDGRMIYDPFVGMCIDRLHIAFMRNPTFTGRPNMNGAVLLGDSMMRNAVANITNMSNLYSIGNVDATVPQRVIGYNPINALGMLGVDPHQQFMYWRGMIQYKGTNSAVSALSNSSHIAGIDVSECWAFDVGGVGSMGVVSYDHLKTSAGDFYNGVATYTQLALPAAITVADNDSLRWLNNGTISHRAKLTSIAKYTSADVLDSITNRGTLRNNLADDAQYFISPVLFDDAICIITPTTQIYDDIALTSALVNLPFVVSAPVTIHRNTVRVIADIATAIDTTITITGHYYTGDGTLLIFHVSELGTRTALSVNTFTNGAVYCDIIVAGVIVGGTYEVYVNEELSYSYDIAMPSTVTLTESHFSAMGELLVTHGAVNVAYTTEYRINIPVHIIENTSPYTLYVDGAVMAYSMDGDAIMVSDIQSEYRAITTPTALVKGVHYDTINSDIINLHIQLQDYIFDTIEFLAVVPDYTTPFGYYVDKITHGVVSEIEWYDPARREYPSIARGITHYGVDPAVYGVDGWGAERSNSIWCMEDHSLRFAVNTPISPVNAHKKVPYTSRVSAWVTSTTHPSEWAVGVIRDGDDAQIPTDKKRTGVVQQVLYMNTRATVDDDWGDWSVVDDTRMIMYGLDTVTLAGDTIIDCSGLGILSSDQYTLEVNGIAINSTAEYTGINITHLATPLLSASDYIVVTKSRPIPPVSVDEALALVIYRFDYAYNTHRVYNPTTRWYDYHYSFWVEDCASRAVGGASALDIGSTINNPSIEIAILADLHDGVYSTVHVLGDSALDWCDILIRSTKTPMPDFREWYITHERDSLKIPRELWDRVTSSVVGYDINTSATLPAPHHVYYDSVNHTSTRYGFVADKIMAPGNIILNTIWANLRSPSSDINPVDRVVFLTAHPFNASTVIDDMNALYNTMPTLAVNRIFFDVLRDCAAYADDLGGAMKTSYVVIDCAVDMVAR